jgi:TetR/AcrR family transcriptional regulator, ethionamide resistance regulator
MSGRPGGAERRAQGRRGRGQPGAPPDGTGQPALRESILAATERLLAERSFADLAVSEILAAAGVSRGSFYFYFDSKHDVLAELVRRAVARGHQAAGPWLAGPDDQPGHQPGNQTAALRAGISAGAELWRASAPVLRAIVENWRTDPRLTALWLQQMQTFTDVTVARITADPAAAQRLAGQDVPALASALTWLGERLYYLAALGTPPFDDQDTLVETLLLLWTSALAGPPGPVSR